MRIPLLPGKFACNRGKRVTRSAELWHVFNRLRAKSPVSASSGICRQLQGKNRGQQGICSGMSGGGAAPLLENPVDNSSDG
jgi:hypothetical protein